MNKQVEAKKWHQLSTVKQYSEFKQYSNVKRPKTGINHKNWCRYNQLSEEVALGE